MADLFSHPSDDAGAHFDQSGWIGSGTGERKVDAARLDVSETGVYRVTVTLSSDAMLFGQRRNLIDPSAKAGTRSFLTCLTEYIPSMQSRVNGDRILFASAVFGRITEIRAERTDARRVFIAGDSTVADQYALAEYYPCDSYAGWGQMLSCFLPEDAVCNMAHSGLTAKCFIEDGHFEIVKRYMKAGDLLLIQFGHNDQKRREGQARAKYPAYLAEIAGAALSVGAKPVLLSPVSRVPSYDAAGAFDLLYDHAQAVGKLAERLGLPFIDLHAFTYGRYLAMGEKCRDLFKDLTHSNDPGAFEIARFVAQKLAFFGLCRAVFPEAGFIAGDRTKNPHSPRPAPLPVPYVDIGDVPDSRVVFEAVQKGLLDPCVLHMHPFDPMPRAEFIQKLFRALGLKTMPTDGVAPYPDVSAREFDAPYAAACRKTGLVPEEAYRPDDPVSSPEVNGMLKSLKIDARLTDTPMYPAKYELIRLLLTLCSNQR